MTNSGGYLLPLLAIDDIIYYPSTQKAMMQELRMAIVLYQEHRLTNDEFYFLISHYTQNFSFLLLSDDYSINIGKAHLGDRSTRMLEMFIS